MLGCMVPSLVIQLQSEFRLLSRLQLRHLDRAVQHFRKSRRNCRIRLSFSRSVSRRALSVSSLSLPLHVQADVAPLEQLGPVRHLHVAGEDQHRDDNRHNDRSRDFLVGLHGAHDVAVEATLSAQQRPEAALSDHAGEGCVDEFRGHGYQQHWSHDGDELGNHGDRSYPYGSLFDEFPLPSIRQHGAHSGLSA